MTTADAQDTRHPAAPGTGITGWSGRTIVAVLVAIFVLFFIVPLVWLLLATTKSAHGLIVDTPFRPGSIGDLTANWKQLFDFQDGAVTTWVANSALYALGALVVTLVASIPAGYALALTEFRFRRLLLVLTLVVMLIPNTALVLPIFLELNVVGLIGSPLSVILPMSFFPFGVYLTYIYFSTIGLTSLLASTPAFNPSSAGTQSVQLPTLALATVISVLPVLVVFLFSQRFLVAGMTAGGTKE